MTTPTINPSVKGGMARRDKSLKKCVCPTCGVVLNRTQRIKLGLPSDLDTIGSEGGKTTARSHNHEHYVNIGGQGGRGRKKHKSGRDKAAKGL